MQLIQVWRWRWEFRLLRLEGFPDFPNSSQDPVARVQEALLQTCSKGEKISNSNNKFSTNVFKN